MKKFTTLATSFAIAGALAASGMTLSGVAMAHPKMSPAHGHEGGEHHSKSKHKHRSEMHERLASELALTEGQQAQLKANREANADAHKAQRKQMRGLRQQLREAIKSGADQATLDSLGAELGQLTVQRMQQRQLRHQQFEAILTDEQKTKLAELKESRKARWKERHKSRDGAREKAGDSAE